jgi:hypothetical protein
MTNEKVTMPARQLASTRRRNPRGQGERLRDDSIEALTLATVTHLLAELISRPDALTENRLHGIVSLRISRTKFPWPPLEPTVRTAVGSLLDAGRPFKDH